MAVSNIRHGTNAGYKAELATGNPVCERCRNARRVFQSQYTKTAKRQGIKYGANDVIDHLYRPSSKRTRTGPTRTETPVRTAGDAPSSPVAPDTDQADTGHGPDATDRPAPGMAERFGEMLKQRFSGSNDYVEDPDIPDYLHPVDADPEPAGQEWKEDATDFVITQAGMAKIEDNLGTYLSVIGMTVDMIDPYCGPVLAENFDTIVNRWSKVIAHYPKAAELFMSEKGGVLFSWISALQATWPFLYALYEHHLARNVKVEKGQVYRRTQNGQGPVIDPLLPPQDNFQYSTN